MTADRPVEDLTSVSDRVFEWNLAKWEAAPPAAESFDPRAALLRVLALADELDAEGCDAPPGPGVAKWEAAKRIRAVIEGRPS